MGGDWGEKAKFGADGMKVQQVFTQRLGEGLLPGIGQQQVQLAPGGGFQKRVGIRKKFRLDDQVRIGQTQGMDQICDKFRMAGMEIVQAYHAAGMGPRSTPRKGRTASCTPQFLPDQRLGVIVVDSAQVPPFDPLVHMPATGPQEAVPLVLVRYNPFRAATGHEAGDADMVSARDRDRAGFPSHGPFGRNLELIKARRVNRPD